MIVEAILNLGYDVVFLLLTPIEFVLQPIGSFAGLAELLGYASIFLPVNVFLQCIIIWVAFQSFRLVVAIGNWLIAKIPTIS